MMNKKDNENVRKLEELGLISTQVVQRRDRDIEIYLKEKVRNDKILLRELVNQFKIVYPDITVSLPISL